MKSYTRDLSKGRPIFLWGGTMYGEITYRVLTQLYHIDVKGVIDNKLSSITWADVPVIRSKDIAGQFGIDILVCAANAFENIVKEAKSYTNKDIRLYDCREILKDYKEACTKQIISSKSMYLYGNISLDKMIEKYNFYAGGVKRTAIAKVSICPTVCCALQISVP